MPRVLTCAALGLAIMLAVPAANDGGSPPGSWVLGLGSWFCGLGSAVPGPGSPPLADTIPDRYSDAEFWRLVTDFSEPGGYFPYENFVSNEAAYQDIIGELARRVPPGGVYLGVAPEQNFTYIAAVRPKVAFIFDIRRQNLIEHLMYKALFEMSPTRAEFISRLFSRRCSGTVGSASSVESLFQACGAGRGDSALHAETLRMMRDRLVVQHRFALVGDDTARLAYVFNVFYLGGPRMDYAYASASPGAAMPSYIALMTARDRAGRQWAFLASEDAYQRVRAMEQRNLIVPIVGDFAGTQALKAVAAYLRNHGATVGVFYISNVEDYLPQTWAAYRQNLEAMPVNARSLFIRFSPGRGMALRAWGDVGVRWPGRGW